MLSFVLHFIYYSLIIYFSLTFQRIGILWHTVHKDICGGVPYSPAYGLSSPKESNWLLSFLLCGSFSIRCFLRLLQMLLGRYAFLGLTPKTPTKLPCFFKKPTKLSKFQKNSQNFYRHHKTSVLVLR